MLKATRDLKLPTTITGSLPRPAWYTENLGSRPFRDALGDARYREQYTDAVGTYIRDQERAGLDIVTDGSGRTGRRTPAHCPEVDERERNGIGIRDARHPRCGWVQP
jgi:hypothetical protein